MPTQLVALPHLTKALIVVGTTVRKKPEVLKWYLMSLERMEVPMGTEVRYLFVDDMLGPEYEVSKQMLAAFVDQFGGEIIPGTVIQQVGLYDDGHAQTHQWSGESMARVGQLKNIIIQKALAARADALFLADADLVMDPGTLRSLWTLEAPVACAVYWTRWVNDPRIHAAPQVWLNHPYILQGRGYLNEGEFRGKLLSRNPVPVWGQGACTLIRRMVLEKGVDFTILPELPKDNMWAGEDRHFCVKCERLHIPMIADGWPDIFHIYHPQDVEQAEKWFNATEAHSGPPKIGDLVSLKLEALESVVPGPRPLPVGRIVRGRLGRLDLLPELEDAITEMQVGEQSVVPCHIGNDYPFEQYRNSRRLFRVTLLDTKPFRLPPVVQDEVYEFGSGATIDGATLTPELHAGIKEAASV